jgi:hypothetical protein
VRVLSVDSLGGLVVNANRLAQRRALEQLSEFAKGSTPDSMSNPRSITVQ